MRFIFGPLPDVQIKKLICVPLKYNKYTVNDITQSSGRMWLSEKYF